ncbi:MAG: hypothetical protein QOJ76_2799, partial [Acidobacteriota bacterium]|nr:hypothetical protein [Acidobacteriota bacterium]
MQNEMIEGFRLSPQQQHLWPLQQHSDSFQAQCAVFIEGALRRDLLTEALRRVVMRHEILRTGFRLMPGVDLPWQIIEEEAAAALREVEFDATGDARQQLEACLREERSHRCPDEQGSPLRALLAKVDEHRHFLALTLPSLCMDAWSLKNLLHDVVLLYAAAAAGEELDDEAVQYVDFSEWQYELLESEEKRAGREFWQRQQQETAEMAQLSLPLENNATPAAEYHPETVTVEVDGTDLRRLESPARGYEATTETVLLACWQVFLWRLTNTPEFVVDTAFDGGKYADLCGSVGLFLKHLPLRAALKGGETFGDVVRHVAQAHKEAYRRQEYFNRGRGEGVPEDGNSKVGFEYEEWPESLSAAQLTFTLSHLSACSERFKLKLTASRTSSEGLRLVFTYDSSVLTRESVQRWADAYLTLLHRALDQPQTPIANLPAIGEAERRQLLLDRRRHDDTAAPSGLSLLELFERHVSRSPDALAVIHHDDRLTYAELKARANRLAHHLLSLGVGSEVVVAVVMERSVEMLVAVLAVWKAGGAYLPLDPSYPQERLAFMIDDAQARVVLTQQHLLGSLPGHAAQLLCVDADQELFLQQSRENPTHLTTPGHMAYVIYTSGSTGQPKGVAVEHAGLLNLHAALRCDIYEKVEADAGGRQLRVSLNAPLCFDASVKQLIQLLSGHTLVVIPEELRLDPAALLDYLSRHQVDLLDSTPSLLRLMMAEGLADGAVPSLRAVLS